MNKDLKKMVNQLSKMVGEANVGLLIAGILDSFNEIANGENFELRSLRLVFNDFFEKEIIKGEGK